MAKTARATLIMGGLLSLAALTACGGTSSLSGDSSSSASTSSSRSVAAAQDINIQLVPSNDPVVLATRAKSLEPFLNSYEPGFKFHITVGTSYAATTTALANSQIDAGFLTASGYAEATIEYPNKVEVLLSSSRAGYKVQVDDFPGFDDAAKTKQRQAMNGEITVSGAPVTSANASQAYSYLGEQSATPVNFYSGIMISRRDSFGGTIAGAKTFDANHDGVITVQELHDGKAKIGIMGAESGSGFIYPTFMLYNLGFTKGFVPEDDYNALNAADQAKALIGVNETSYPTGINMLMAGQLDAACGFFDIRYGSAYVQKGGPFENDPTIFTNTYTVGITDPIMNDTISVAKSLAADKRAAIRDAFNKAVKDGDKTTENTPAWVLYQIYSHTGYVDAKDSDYDAARAMYLWQTAHAS